MRLDVQDGVKILNNKAQLARGRRALLARASARHDLTAASEKLPRFVAWLLLVQHLSALFLTSDNGRNSSPSKTTADGPVPHIFLIFGGGSSDLFLLRPFAA